SRVLLAEGGTEAWGELACQRLAVEAGAFLRCGYVSMDASCAETLLKVYPGYASASETELAVAVLANAALRGKPLKGHSVRPIPMPPPPPPGQGSEHPTTPVKAHSWRSGPGPGLGPESGSGSGSGSVPGLGLGSGRGSCLYEEALGIFLRLHRAYPNPVSNLWVSGVGVMMHEWMVNRGELNAAQGLGVILLSCTPLMRGAEAYVEARLQRVRLLRAQGRRWDQALTTASALAKLCDARGLAPQYARLLLEISRARLGAEPDCPLAALPPALRCLAVCESFSMDSIHASTLRILGEV
ncbi:unnamed protein product, partial [Discosporangium mesarthrocarpum]